MELTEAISRDPEIVSGALCFAGTRVPVKFLFDYLESGSTVKDFQDSFPTVELEKVRAVVALASGLIESLEPLSKSA
jgi:uncharacterized protein (DUF433 family)